MLFHRIFSSMIFRVRWNTNFKYFTIKYEGMRIEIRKNMRQVVIISFHTRTENFESDYERSKFFRGLYGWKQTVPKENKKYLYRRSGLLDEVPHIKIADSVFMTAMENMKRVMEYFEQWSEKVDYEIMEAMMDKRRIKMI